MPSIVARILACRFEAVNDAVALGSPGIRDIDLRHPTLSYPPKARYDRSGLRSGQDIPSQPRRVDKVFADPALDLVAGSGKLLEFN